MHPSDRFGFGENWLHFARSLKPEQIVEAEQSLTGLLGHHDLSGLSFLDIGSGSGLFSLAARKLGARVLSFDFDPQSVTCTQALRDQYCPNDPAWTIERGSVLDLEFIGKLGAFDIVYSWGVLHHTGSMWIALQNAAGLVVPGGYLVVALYRRTKLCWAWKLEKRFYASAPSALQTAIRGVYKTSFLVGKAARGQNPIAFIRGYKSNRGMDWYHDVHDWLGGYPYESAPHEKIEERIQNLGFDVVRTLARVPGIGFFGSGCDEFVAVRRSS